MIAVGSCNGDVTSTILQTIMEKSETELKDTYARWLPLGLGLNHLGEEMFIKWLTDWIQLEGLSIRLSWIQASVL